MSINRSQRLSITAQLKTRFTQQKRLYAYAAVWEHRVIAWMLEEWEARYPKAKRLREFQRQLIESMRLRPERWVWYHSDIEFLLSQL